MATGGIRRPQRWQAVRRWGRWACVCSRLCIFIPVFSHRDKQRGPPGTEAPTTELYVLYPMIHTRSTPLKYRIFSMNYLIAHVHDADVLHPNRLVIADRP